LLACGFWVYSGQIAAPACDGSDEMKALRLRALEMLSGDGEW
jgi:hypothetical protein